ncbi:MAG: hypothetical protein JKX99_02180 [Robiginitomaculum sp.]|nr:hypothetical protein [Robiginitomaculum sp.]
MLFLFNDVIFEIGQPTEVIQSEAFPITSAAFVKMRLSEIVTLACEAVFADIQLPHNQPEVAKNLSVLLAAKIAANAVLIGVPAEGAKEPADLGLRMAEVSLLTIAHLFQLQQGGTLLPQHVQQAVWQSLQ